MFTNVTNKFWLNIYFVFLWNVCEETRPHIGGLIISLCRKSPCPHSNTRPGNNCPHTYAPDDRIICHSSFSQTIRKWPDNLPLPRQGHGRRLIKANYRHKAGSERGLTPSHHWPVSPCFLFVKIFEDTNIPHFVLLTMSPLGLKGRVKEEWAALFVLGRGVHVTHSLRSTSGVAPALVVCMAAYPFSSICQLPGIGWLKTGTYHSVRPDRCTTGRETDKSYHFFGSNQQNAGIKSFSWTQYDFSVNRCDWRILAGSDKRVVRNCLNRGNRLSCFFETNRGVVNFSCDSDLFPTLLYLFYCNKCV